MKLMALHLRRLFAAGVVVAVIVILAGCSKTATSLPPSATIPKTTIAQPTITGTPGLPSPSVTASTPSATAVTTTAAPTVTPSPSPIPTSTPSPTTPVLSTSTLYPIIGIISPGYAATVPAGDVTISVSVANFNLVDKSGQAAVPGEGHIIYYFDKTPPTVSGQSALTEAGTYAVSANTAYTWPKVSHGAYFFSVQLVNNDNTPLNPKEVFTELVNVQ